MLYKFSQLVQDFGIKPQGVLHIGANTGQEAEEYYANGILRTAWFEADPAVMPALQAHIAKFPNAKAFNECCHMISGLKVNLNITSNGSESSSILAMGTHKEKHPDVLVTGQTPVTTKRIDNIFKDNNLNFADYDFLNIDVQGVELYVLKGFGNQGLEHIKYVYVEVNKEELYVGCSKYDDLNQWLIEKGFKQVAVKWAGDAGWGDAFYMRDGVGVGVTPGLPAGATQLPPAPPQRSAAELKTLSAEEMAFSNLAKKRGLVIRGIINAGAGIGNDILQYKALKIPNIMMIEPNPQAFEIMRQNYQVDAILKNVALSEFNGNGNINVSTGDEGRSDSMLYPKIYTNQYPNVKFHGNRHIMSQQLDSLGVDVGKYNALHLDVNGYELNALRGCLNFLEHCGYVYTKVYYAELWEKGALLKEVQAFLEQFNFGLVDVSREGQTWGYALFIKKNDVAYPSEKPEQPAFKDADQAQLQNAYLAASPGNEFVADIPLVFRPHILKPFPADNVIPFEEWYYANFAAADHVKDKVYLPIFWNSYYINNDAENRPGFIQDLQNFLNTLDPEKEYYTICMYHNGILNDVSKLKLTVFGVHPEKSNVVIPPVCLPHAYNFDGVEKDLFISYVGPRLHPVRQKLVELMPTDNKKIFITTDKMPLEEYCRTIARSRYVLCPVGFKGINYRMAEALQYGAMPIVFNEYQDVPLPHKLYNKPVPFEYGLDVAGINNMVEEINRVEKKAGYLSFDEKGNVDSILQLRAKVLHRTYFTYEGCKEMILDIANNGIEKVQNRIARLFMEV